MKQCKIKQMQTEGVAQAVEGLCCKH
jgi:hypothetical protein